MGTQMALAPETAAMLVDQIFDLQRAVRCIAASTSRGERTGPAMHFVLRLLREGECRATRLAARLGIGAPVLSRHIADLEEQGLIVRKKDPSDGRAQLVAITQLGLERLHQFDAHRSEAFHGHLADWDEGDALLAAKTLRRLTQTLTGSAAAARTDT